MKMFKTLALTTVCVLLGAIVAWQFNSVKQNQVITGLEKQRVSDLVQQILAERNNNEKLQLRINEMQTEIDAFSKEENVDDAYVESLKKYVLTARIIAGLETVMGSGLIITLDASGERTIRDSHILDLLNELKASDVQAIAINDERIVATSEIRKAGHYIMVNGRQLVPPYSIKTIGDPVKMENSLNLIGGIIETFKLYGFDVTLERQDNIIVPAVRDDGTVLRYDMLNPIEP